MKERRPQLEVFLSDLLKLAQHLLYSPDKPELLVPLPPHFGNVAKQPGGIDGVEVFEKVEV
jgi:hypothetical protein